MLDKIDRQIIELLKNDARLSFRELGETVFLSANTVADRVRRLVHDKVLLGFHAEVDPDALGLSLQAMITVRLRRHSRREVIAFRSHLLALSEVLAVYHVGGSYDFLVHVAVRDSNHLRDLALDAFTTRPEVGQMETHLIFEYCRSTSLPVPQTTK